MSHRRYHRHPSIFRPFRRGNTWCRGHPDARTQWPAIDLSDESEIHFLDQNLYNSYKCAICMNIIKDPVSIGCSGGHIFCKTCIHQAVRANRNRSQHAPSTCPSCRDPFTRNEIRDDNFAKRMIGDLKIKCPNYQVTPKRQTLIQQQSRQRDARRSSRERNNNNNSNSRSRSRSRSRERNENKEDNDEKQQLATCDWSGEYRNIKTHLSGCEFGIIPCVRCCKPILRNKITEHRNVCPGFILKCDACNNTYFRCERHLCPEEVINCRHCEIQVRRNQMRIHWDVCNKKPIVCDFFAFGCCELIRRENMTEHVLQNQSNHLLMVRNKCNELEELEQKYEELQENYDEMDDKYDTLETEHEELQTKYEELQEKNEELQEQHDGVEGRLVSVEAMMLVLARKVFNRT